MDAETEALVCLTMGCNYFRRELYLLMLFGLLLASVLAVRNRN